MHRRSKVKVEVKSLSNLNIRNVKFASGIKNINFGFTHTQMCVSTVYSSCLMTSGEKAVYFFFYKYRFGLD